MSGFRAGDRLIEIDGKTHRLRMSVSSLAGMADAFEAENPKALADRLRRASLKDWNVVLNTVSIPPIEQSLSRDEMASLMPVLSDLIRYGLRA